MTLEDCKWFLTPTAVDQFRRIRRYENTEEDFQRARKELAGIIPHATLRQVDSHGREMWKTTRQHYHFRMIVSHGYAGKPQLVWAGQGKPPERHWAPAPPPETAPSVPRTRPSRGEAPRCPTCGDLAIDGKATCGRPGHFKIEPHKRPVTLEDIEELKRILLEQK